MIIIPTVAGCSSKAYLHSLLIDNLTYTGTFIIFVEPASAASLSSNQYVVVNENENLNTLPALELVTPHWAGLTGWVGYAVMRFRPLESDSYISVMDIGTSSAEIPHLTMQSSLIPGCVGSVSAELPTMYLSANDTLFSGRGAILLRSLELGATGVRGVILSGDLKIRSPSIEGEFESPGEGSDTMILRGMDAAGVMIAGYLFSAILTFPSLRSAGSLHSGHLGSADLILPVLTIGASGYGFSDGQGSSGLTYPPLTIFGIIDLSQFAYQDVYVSAMNLASTAVSDYERFAFNSYCSSGDYGYGAKDDGIYEFIGSQDGTDDIFAEVRKVSMDLERFDHKRFTDAYFHLHSDGPYRIVVYADQISSEQEVDDPGGGIHAWKVALPRGVKGQGLGIAVKAFGTDFILDEVAMVSEFTSRRNR